MPRTLIAVLTAACVAAVLPALTPGSSAETATNQRATLRVSPGIVQNTGSVANPDDAALLGTVTLRPVHKGRLVRVQRRLGAGPWHTVARRHENADGVVRFRRDDRRGRHPYDYRAIATGTPGGLPRVISNTESTAVWNLRFSDRFRGTSLDRNKWDYRDLGIRKNSRLHAQSARSAVRIGGGAVSLLVRKNPHRPKHYYLNGHIGTSGKFSFRYGYAAARIKFEKGQGQHGSFWMQPQSHTASYGSAARTGTEIDVAEFFGKGASDGGMASYVYSYPSRTRSVKSGRIQPSANKALVGRSDSWWSRYHVFSVHWTRSGYVFRIDGVETWRHGAHVSRRPQYLILSLLTSDWELPRLNRSALPNSMKVDWVRVWQR